MPATEAHIYFNGVDGVTGRYLVPPITFSEAAAILTGETPDTSVKQWLKKAWQAISQLHLGAPLGVDLAEPAQAGWGIVFHQDTPYEVREALAPLLAQRVDQIGKSGCHVLEYSRQEPWATWMARHGVTAGTVNPAKVPYYLLLIGGPEEIPFGFEALLNVEYAVGRLSFNTPDEYRRYAESLVAYERNPVPANSKMAVFFAPRHALDPSTQMSADQLVGPLAARLMTDTENPLEPSAAVHLGYEIRRYVSADATKANLQSILCGGAAGRPPALLFSASHGLGWPRGHPDQLAKQGALVCQEWPGAGRVGPDEYFCGADLPEGARVHGLIAFIFACYSTGAPRIDQFLHMPSQPAREIAAQAFVSALPKRMLAHPNGGALAVIGHVDRAWGCSIAHPQAGVQIQPFSNALERMLAGAPVGHALRDFRERYAMLSTHLSALLEQASFGARLPDEQLAMMWIERNDAQNYCLMGDPAARLRV